MHEKSSTPPSAAVRLQLEGPIFALVEDWRRAQPEIFSRSKAVRVLLELALNARPNGSRPRELRRRPSTPSRVTTKTVPATSPA
jgi:hypothetical protein